MNKKNLKIAGATAMTVFSLVAVFTAAIAWFSINKHVRAEGFTIKANKNVVGRLGQVEIHKCLGIIGTGNSKTYSFDINADTTFVYDWVENKTTISGSTDVFPLGNYTPMDTDHPLLMVFVLNDEYVSTSAGDIYIKGSTGKAGFLGEVADTGGPMYTLGPSCPLYMGTKTVPALDDSGNPILDDEGEPTTKEVDSYPLSSVVNFKCDYFSKNAYEALEAKSSSELSANDRINMLASDLTDANEAFVNFNTNATFKEFKPRPTIFTSPGKDSSNNPTPIQYITMVVNYDSNAISAIYTTYLGDTTLEGTYGEELYFSCDWSLEVF